MMKVKFIVRNSTEITQFVTNQPLSSDSIGSRARINFHHNAISCTNAGGKHITFKLMTTFDA